MALDTASGGSIATVALPDSVVGEGEAAFLDEQSPTDTDNSLKYDWEQQNQGYNQKSLSNLKRFRQTLKFYKFHLFFVLIKHNFYYERPNPL